MFKSHYKDYIYVLVKIAKP